MYRNHHNRFMIALVAGCAAALAGPASGVAQTPSTSADVQVGQIQAGLDSEDVRQKTNAQAERSIADARRTLADAQSKLRTTESQIRQLERQLRNDLSARRARINRDVATRRQAALKTVSELKYRANRLSTQVMRASITLATATAEGGWVIVNRSGDVLNQSGGASVNRNGRGWYTVKFNTNRNGCASVASSNPSPSGTSGGIRVTPLGDGSFSVRMTESSVRRGGGFFLALTC
jgi:TolA-binding protein